jgi:predicted ribosomally synthesized peptide with nif11-like leader
MSAEGATALYERVTSDEEFRTQLQAAGSPEDKRRIVTEAGYDVSTDDLPTIRNLAGATELSDEDLEKVAGGIGDGTAGGIAGGGAVVTIVAASAAAI